MCDFKQTIILSHNPIAYSACGTFVCIEGWFIFDLLFFFLFVTDVILQCFLWRNSMEFYHMHSISRENFGKKESVTYHHCRFGEAPTSATGRHNWRLLSSILKLSKSASILIFHRLLYLTNCSQVLKSYTKLNNSTRQQSAVSCYRNNPGQEVLNLFSKTSNWALWSNRLKNLQKSIN